MALEDDALKALNQQAKELEDQERLAHLRHKISEQENQIQTLLAERGRQREFVQMVADAVRVEEPFPATPYSGGGTCESPISHVIKFSDWQIGEQIFADETEGFGEFNWKIAQERVQYFVEKNIDYVQTQRNSYQIDELVVLCEGDFISGDHNMHEQDLYCTNEFPAAVQTARAGELLGAAIQRFASHYKTVRVVEMGADNHGRTTRRIRSKHAGLDNYNYLVYTVANAKLARHRNIEIETSPGNKILTNINGKRFLVEHGHAVNAYMGTPYYGLDRHAGREAQKRRLRPSKQYDYISIGHWHVPAIVSGFILVNGSLTGTTELDHLVGRYAPPSQVSFLVHPKHGVFGWTPWGFKEVK